MGVGRHAVRAFSSQSTPVVPDVFVQFGLEQQFRFISHPGVMVLSKLLEMKTISKMGATFTPENIEEMKKFDPELARKAQIAYDHKLPINFCSLELIEEQLPRLLEEKTDRGCSCTSRQPPRRRPVRTQVGRLSGATN